MKRLLVYRPAAQRELSCMDRSDAERVTRVLEVFRYRLRVGKWRVFFSIDQPGSIIVSDIDNCGQAY